MLKTFSLMLGLLVFSLAGFFLGRWTLENQEVDQSLLCGQVIPTISPDKTLSDVDGNSEQKSLVQKQQPSARLGYAADFTQMQLLLRLAESNPIAALEQATELRGELKTKTQTEILAIWASIDPAGAWQWLQTNQPDNTQGLVALLEVIGSHHPDQVIDLADTYVESHPYMAKDIYHSVLTGMTQAGAYDSASMLLEYLDLPSSIKTELMVYLADRWAVYEPQQALQWVLSKPQNFDTDAMGRLGATWAETHPQGATSFASGLADESRKVMLEQAFNQWLVVDMAGASSWLSAERPSEDLDPLISKLAMTTALEKGQVPEALVWIGRISNTQEQMAALTTILSSIKQKDPAVASHYIEATSYLTPTKRAQLRVDLALPSSQ